jgi:hypothetical protein
LARIARAVLLYPLRLKGPSLGSAHLRGSQPQISNLLRTDSLSNAPSSTLPEYHSSSTSPCVDAYRSLYLDPSDLGILFSKNYLRPSEKRFCTLPITFVAQEHIDNLPMLIAA